MKALWIALSVCGLLGWAALAAADQPQPDTSSCGHLGEIEAARQALQEGDEEAALAHFRAAREILLACEQQVEAEADFSEQGALEI